MSTVETETGSASEHGAEAPQPGPGWAVVRFGTWSRLTHGVLAVAVFGLVFTGMPLRYAGSWWAHPLMLAWGGPHLAGRFHRLFALLFFTAAAMHIGMLVVALVRKRFPPLRGPDSIVPSTRDVRHLVQNIRYLRHRAPRPDFGRFSYFEKFDYLAEVWGLLVIGGSGLVMWFPEIAARFLPGWVVNAALIFHSYEALLAMGFLFGIHFFNTHLRPDVFPVDDVIFTGRMPVGEVRERYPGWYRRLTTGEASASFVPDAPSPARRRAAAVSTVFLTLGTVMMLLVMSAAIVDVVGQLLHAAE